MDDGGLPPREVARRKITAFYAKFFPDKLDQVYDLLDKYAGKEDDVIKTYRTKYPEWNWDHLPGSHSKIASASPNLGAPASIARPHYTVQSGGGGGGSGVGGSGSGVGIAGKDHNLNITLTLQTQQNPSGGLSPPLPVVTAVGPGHVPPPPGTSLGFDDYSPRRLAGLYPPAHGIPGGELPPPPQHHAGYQQARPGLPTYTPIRNSGGTSAYGANSNLLPAHHPQMHAGGLVVPSTNPTSITDQVSRSEIEGAFAVLESKLTEAQRQDARVLEDKLDQLLSSMSNRMDSRENIHSQLKDVMERVEQLQTTRAPNPTTPSVPEVIQPVNMPSSYDFVDLLKQENSKKNAELDILSANTAMLQSQLGDQQQKYVRDISEMQRKLSQIEGQQQAVHETRELAQKLHSAVAQAAHAQQQAQTQQKQLIEATHVALSKQPPSSQHFPPTPATHQLPQQPPSGSSQINKLQEEIDELRRRDDLSRKLIHEKQMLLDTMFALSHQQNSPQRLAAGFPQMGQSLGMASVGGGTGSPRRGQPGGYPPGQPGGYPPGPSGGIPGITPVQHSHSPSSQVHHHHYPQQAVNAWGGDGSYIPQTGNEDYTYQLG